MKQRKGNSEAWIVFMAKFGGMNKFSGILKRLAIASLLLFIAFL